MSIFSAAYTTQLITKIKAVMVTTFSRAGIQRRVGECYQDIGGILGVCVLSKHKMDSEVNVTTVTDEGLILRVSHGDARSFEKLVDLYQKPALRVAQRCIGQQAEAEDLVQEAFLQVHRYAYRYNPEAASFKTWFFSILLNLCRNAIKRNRSHSFAELPEDATAVDDPESDLAYEEERAALAAAIARLPSNQRLALILRHYEGLSYSEGAAALDLSVHAFRSLLARTRRTLRRELTEFEKKSSD
jgi:RNA polymerase sigma-70 factor, ECF subfamily